MSRQINVLTSFNRPGFDLYGKRMLKTFSSNWPSDITMHVYYQNCKVQNLLTDNFELIDINSIEALKKFKSKHSLNFKRNGYENGFIDFLLRRKTYRYDAVRFSHKSFAMFDCAQRIKDGILLWIDGDTVFHNIMTREEIENLCPSDMDYGFFGRKNYHSETGLIYFNLSSSKCRDMLDTFIQLYRSNKLFELKEWHDCEAFDYARSTIEGIVGNNWSNDTPEEGEGGWHPLVNSEWGMYIDHLKGGRKVNGRSYSSDLISKRNESYWSD